MTERKKLKISCRTTNCDEQLHCYNRTKTEAKAFAAQQLELSRAVGASALQSGSAAPASGPIRQCKACGIELVDWERVRQNDLGDVVHTFGALKTEWIRHHFWHRQLDQHTVDYAYSKGRLQLEAILAAQIRRGIGKPMSEQYLGGRIGTSYGIDPSPRNVLYFAQHATASCCRECMEGWHGIPRDTHLTDDQITYVTTLGMLFIADRLPTLPPTGGATPPVGAGIGTTVLSDFAPRKRKGLRREQFVG